MNKIIKVVPHDPEWAAIFVKEASLIRAALGDNCLHIHHVGSTSVPGLAAKPKIDIIVVVRNASAAINHLQEVGFGYRGEYNIPMSQLFAKRDSIEFNLHLYEQDHPEIELNLVFRDYLRAYKEARAAYAELKYNLLKDESAHKKENSIFANYTLRKADFIRSILKKAGFNKLRILKCLDGTEWNAAKYFREHYFFAFQDIEDLYSWTFDHSDRTNHLEHAHLILYQGVDIIGYTHLQFWPENKALLRIIVIDEYKRELGMGGKFMSLIEQWLKSLNIQSIHAESRQSSLQFYLKNGYAEMPFAGPENHQIDTNDIAVGKIL